MSHCSNLSWADLLVRVQLERQIQEIFRKPFRKPLIFPFLSQVEGWLPSSGHGLPSWGHGGYDGRGDRGFTGGLTSQRLADLPQTPAGQRSTHQLCQLPGTVRTCEGWFRSEPAGKHRGVPALIYESYCLFSFCPHCGWLAFPPSRVLWSRGMNWESCLDMPTLWLQWIR